MNVEMFFVRSSQTDVSEVILRRLRLPPDPPGIQPDWGLPASYDVLLASEPKRKVALSPNDDGWVAGIESKEVVDFALLHDLSQTLAATVVAVQLSEISGDCGYAMCERGRVTVRQFSDASDDPAGTIAEFLQSVGVRLGLLTFREAVQLRDQSWIIVAAPK